MERWISSVLSQKKVFSYNVLNMTVAQIHAHNIYAECPGSGFILLDLTFMNECAITLFALQTSQG